MFLDSNDIGEVVKRELHSQYGGTVGIYQYTVKLLTEPGVERAAYGFQFVAVTITNAEDVPDNELELFDIDGEELCDNDDC